MSKFTQLTTFLRASLKVVIFVFYISVFLFSGFLIQLFYRNPEKKRVQYTKLGHIFALIALKLFQIHLTVKNRPMGPESEKDVYLLVANHMGFFDILAIAAVLPICFVTSREMRETPILGILSEMGGCIYIERRSRLNIVTEIKHLGEVLKQGQRIALYPEATAHNGEEILPFKRSLLTSAIRAGVPIQPVTFNFREVDGGPFTMKHRDALCWWGPTPFYMALWEGFKIKSMKIELEYLPKYNFSAKDDKAEIAEILHKVISEKFVPVQKDK